MHPDIPRPKRHLIAIGKRYPEAWHIVDDMRADRGIGLPNWPNWCFCPLAGPYAIVSKGDDIPFELVGDVARLGALAAWRVTQGIYRFDPDLLRALWDTPITGDIPRDVLYRLPEWCIYIETPGQSAFGHPLHGFFSHLEYDMNDGRHELRLLLDTGDNPDDLQPYPLHLVPGGITESIRAMVEETKRVKRKHNIPDAPYAIDVFTEAENHIAPLVSLVLYLCSTAAEYLNERRPSNPRPIKTKKGPRLFPPDGPTVWQTGFRIGAALRKAENERRLNATLERRPPRSHIRRAHWHSYWTGPRSEPDQRQLILKWLPPIPVNIDNLEHINPTIRSVTP